MGTGLVMAASNIPILFLLETCYCTIFDYPTGSYLYTNMTSLSIGDEVFPHVKTRLYTPVNIYGNSHSFVRVGPEEIIKRELGAHKRLLEFGFQVAQILDVGEIPEGCYYREESLGERILG